MNRDMKFTDALYTMCNLTVMLLDGVVDSYEALAMVSKEIPNVTDEEMEVFKECFLAVEARR